MRILDLFIVAAMIILLSAGSYVLWYNVPSAPVNYQDFTANVSFSANSSQFYPNMRYSDRIITYTIEQACNNQKVTEIEQAFSILSQKTILQFKKADSDGEIKFLCSEVAPTSEEKGHFIAGEGGPSKIINSTNFYVVLNGRVSLYRSDKCAEPKVALHETLHALGFDHDSNPESIMYPVTDCNQQIDQSIIDEINRLYSVDSLPDWMIEKVSATKRGIYLDFDILFGNDGLRDAQNAKLEIYSNNVKVKEYTINNTQIGMKTILNAQNLRIDKSAQGVKFEITTPEAELSKTNNIAELALKE